MFSRTISVLLAVLSSYHVVEGATLINKLLGRTLLQHLTVLNDHDAVRAEYGAQTVRNDQRCAALGCAVECLLDNGLAFIVQCRRRFIQKENVRRLDEGAGNGDSLTLLDAERKEYVQL